MQSDEIMQKELAEKKELIEKKTQEFQNLELLHNKDQTKLQYHLAEVTRLQNELAQVRTANTALQESGLQYKECNKELKEQVEVLTEEYNQIKVKLDNAEYMLANVRGSSSFMHIKNSMKENEGLLGSPDKRPNDMEEYDFVKMQSFNEEHDGRMYSQSFNIAPQVELAEQEVQASPSSAANEAQTMPMLIFENFMTSQQLDQAQGQRIAEVIAKMVETGNVGVIEWTKPPVQVSHEECQTDSKPITESFTQTEILAFSEAAMQTMEKELLDTEAQTEIEVATQGLQTEPLPVASVETMTIIKEFKETAMQSEYYQLFTASDVQTDEVEIKKPGEGLIETKTVHTQTLKVKPQQRTVGFQIDSEEQNKKIHKTASTQTSKMQKPTETGMQTEQKELVEAPCQTIILHFAESDAQTTQAVLNDSEAQTVLLEQKEESAQTLIEQKEETVQTFTEIRTIESQTIVREYKEELCQTVEKSMQEGFAQTSI